LRRWFRPDRHLPVDRAPVALLALPGPRRDYLRGHGHIRPRYRVAYDDHGAPIGMSQTVQDGGWAGLASLVTSPGHPHAQTVRYLLHSQVVEDLIDQQVSRLVVGGSVLLTTSGTRYFQRRNGYRPVRLRIRAGDSRRREGTGASEA
jgi:hypothetical protein